jgi:hypothetical protein
MKRRRKRRGKETVGTHKVVVLLKVLLKTDSLDGLRRRCGEDPVNRALVGMFKQLIDRFFLMRYFHDDEGRRRRKEGRRKKIEAGFLSLCAR